jgi:glycosyltransferase involved in cell wall biosynthesis
MGTRARPLVTIGISTYNRANSYLPAALQSALAQTYPNLEIVVSDNCSTDHTEALMRGVDDPRIRYFRQAANIGPNNNYNFCLQQARGEFFLLLHDDDLIDKDFVDVCLDAVDGKAAVGIVRTGTRVIDGNGAVRTISPNRVGGLSTEDFILGWFAGKTALYLCSTLFNTARLREIGGFQSKKFLFQDVVAEMKLAARYGRVDVSEVKASFRRHGSNKGSAARVDDWVEDSLFLLDQMTALVSDAHRERIRGEGMAYLCRKSYRYVAALSPLSRRLKAFYVVYRRFGRTYSPVQYLKTRYLRSVRRRVRRALGLSV